MTLLGNGVSSAENEIRSAGRDTGLPLTARTSMRGTRFPLCKCSCHRVAWARSLPWLHPAFGTFSLKYSALHGRCEPCNTSLCHSVSDTFFNVQYHFPPWLAARAVLASLSWRTLIGLGASLWIRVPRIVYKTGITYILRSDDIESIERRLSDLQILPTDIEGIYGRTLLTVSTCPRTMVMRLTDIACLGLIHMVLYTILAPFWCRSENAGSLRQVR